jgi:hypothetical protein
VTGQPGPDQPGAWTSADYPSAYQPTPYDLYLTDDPDATWAEVQADAGPEAEAL